MVDSTIPRFAIFDLDGVLVESDSAHYGAYERLFREEGIEFSMEDFVSVARGVQRDDVLRAVLGEVDPGRLEDMKQRKARYVRAHLSAHGLGPIPGMLELVRELKDLGWGVAVATVSRMPRPFLSAIGASHLFGIIVDGSSVAAPKPAPDVYLEAARRLSARPQECVAVEDSPVGIVSALDAGMEVHALTTTCDRRALVQAHHVHDSAQALRRALLRGHQPR